MIENELTMDFVVGDSDTAVHLESGGLMVLATPRLIAWAEKTAFVLASKSAGLAEGEDTVGTSVEIKHLAASAVGARVNVTAILNQEKSEGRKLFFDISAYDENGKILEGTHQRFVINKERFMKKVNEKK